MEMPTHLGDTFKKGNDTRGCRRHQHQSSTGRNFSRIIAHLHPCPPDWGITIQVGHSAAAATLRHHSREVRVHPRPAQPRNPTTSTSMAKNSPSTLHDQPRGARPHTQSLGQLPAVDCVTTLHPRFGPSISLDRLQHPQPRGPRGSTTTEALGSRRARPLQAQQLLAEHHATRAAPRRRRLVPPCHMSSPPGGATAPQPSPPASPSRAPPLRCEAPSCVVTPALDLAANSFTSPATVRIAPDQHERRHARSRRRQPPTTKH